MRGVGLGCGCGWRLLPAVRCLREKTTASKGDCLHDITSCTLLL